MKLIALILAWAVCLAGAQTKDDIPECSRQCFSTDRQCTLEKDPACVCGAYQIKNLELTSCISSYCSEQETTVNNAIYTFESYCARNNYLSSTVMWLATRMTTTGSPTSTNGVTASSTSTTTSTSSSSSSSDPPTDSGLSTGAKAGIAIGVAVLAIIGAVFLFLWRRKKKRRAISGNREGIEDTGIPELSSGDRANRHELESKGGWGFFGRKDHKPVELSSTREVQELDGTTYAFNGKQGLGNVVGNTTSKVEDSDDTPAVELDATPARPKSPAKPRSPVRPRSPVDSQLVSTPKPAAEAERPRSSREHVDFNSSQPLLPSADELEQLLREEEELRQRKQTLEQLMRVQEEEYALKERIKALRQQNVGQSSEGA
ncbi:uncharacterized protein CTRU02_210676 [Colletotrichum truncatum]|uniref:Uncharacterized protein n=1 Tax=Colletotrichum truncatum TaxID=5467 RepID=A0ACC3YPW7_COLTU|nr:uncharacterized protein CTRU02_03830 [Colletotrichum truncatum]KAF6796852.1 hypothetical protein CTRU02_03830 [Colletotrichum truncatum]